MGSPSDSGVTRVVLACGECGTHWYPEAEAAKCAEPDHQQQHQRFDVHCHRAVVALPDGTEVTAVSFDPVAGYARDQPPDYGLYLDPQWQPPWVHGHLNWPDFGVPDDPAPVVAALRSLLDQARAGERIEVGCLGGHGRTGTALAGLAVLAGHPADDAVAWVRGTYCVQAVETAEQAAFVLDLGRDK